MNMKQFDRLARDCPLSAVVRASKWKQKMGSGRFCQDVGNEVTRSGGKMRAWMYRVSIRRYIDRERDKHYLRFCERIFGKDLVNPFENEDYELR